MDKHIDISSKRMIRELITKYYERISEDEHYMEFYELWDNFCSNLAEGYIEPVNFEKLLNYIKKYTNFEYEDTIKIIQHFIDKMLEELEVSENESKMYRKMFNKVFLEYEENL